MVVLVFGRDALKAEDILEIIGIWSTVCAALGIAIYLSLKGRVSQDVDPSISGQDFLQAHVETLRAQDRLYQTVTAWYLTPLAVGVSLLLVARFPTDGSSVLWTVTVIFCLTVLVGVWLLNRRTARHLRGDAEGLFAGD